jgi:pyrroloquinoline quinone (PQQ) biosynthesis protein C
MAETERLEPNKLNRKECWKIVNEAFDEALRIAHDRLFDHPFTRELGAGTLPTECIRGWLLNSYTWALEINSSAAYKYYLFNDILNQKVDLLAMLADKRGDEYATPGRGGHQRTMDVLGKALGLSSKEMQEYRQLPAMRGMLDSIVWGNESSQRLGMSLAEELLGQWCGLWFQSLVKHYGLTKEEAFYFALHAEADSQTEHQSGESIGHEIMGHGQSHRYLAVRIIEDGLMGPEEMKQTVLRQAGLDSYLNFLDAVYATYHPTKGISDVEQTRR